MSHDFADHLVAQWAIARPDLDPDAMGIVARVMRVATLLEQRLATLLERHELSVWEFDMLATLRRNDPAGLSPKRLLREMLLSSGAMTNRIDRLARAGFVERLPNPEDRRGTLVRITDAGRGVVDEAVEDRFQDAAEVVAVLSPGERRHVERGLRKLALALQPEAW